MRMGLSGEFAKNVAVRRLGMRRIVSHPRFVELFYEGICAHRALRMPQGVGSMRRGDTQPRRADSIAASRDDHRCHEVPA
jgi:hypothetical protein